MQILCLSTVFLLVGFIPHKGSAITCYVCNSLNDPGCDDPFQPYTLGISDCSLQEKLEHLIETSESKVCRKIVQTIQGKRRVVRSCGYIEDERDDKACLPRSGTKDIQIKYCACTTDLCNSAGYSTINLLSLGVAIFTAVRSL